MEILAANNKAPKVPVHILPCKIKYDGPAKVSTYFLPEPVDSPHEVQTSTTTPDFNNNKENNRTSWKASFRGRQLRGETVPLPEGYEGVCYDEVKESQFFQVAKRDGLEVEGEEGDEEFQRRYWLVDHTFDNLTVWEHDHPPTPMENGYLKALEYLNYMQVIHDTHDSFTDAE